MPLSLPPYQQGAQAPLNEGIQYYLGQMSPDVDRGADTDLSFSSFGERYFVHVYIASLHDLVNKADLSKLQPYSWRCVVASDGQPTVCCEVSMDSPESPSQLISVYHERCEAELDGLRYIWEMPGVGPEDYELRLLTVPALSLEVFWLHGIPGKDGVAKPDLVLASSSQFDLALPIRQLVSMQTFCDLITPLAATRLQFNDRLVLDK